MKNKKIIENISLKMNLSEKKVKKLLANFTDTLVEKLNDGYEVELPNIGSFYVEKIEEKVVPNKNGTKTLMPPKLVVRYKENSILTEKINS